MRAGLAGAPLAPHAHCLYDSARIWSASGRAGVPTGVRAVSTSHVGTLPSGRGITSTQGRMRGSGSSAPPVPVRPGRAPALIIEPLFVYITDSYIFQRLSSLNSCPSHLFHPPYKPYTYPITRKITPQNWCPLGAPTISYCIIPSSIIP